MTESERQQRPAHREPYWRSEVKFRLARSVAWIAAIELIAPEDCLKTRIGFRTN